MFHEVIVNGELVSTIIARRGNTGLDSCESLDCQYKPGLCVFVFTHLI